MRKYYSIALLTLIMISGCLPQRQKYEVTDSSEVKRFFVSPKERESYERRVAELEAKGLPVVENLTEQEEETRFKLYRQRAKSDILNYIGTRDGHHYIETYHRPGYEFKTHLMRKSRTTLMIPETDTGLVLPKSFALKTRKAREVTITKDMLRWD